MAVNQSITKKFNPNFKDVSYLAKNFSEYRQNLIEFAKSYYPNTYSDFNEASPGMMFVEMAAYVGDVMSFYIDNQFKENLLLFAKERNNVVSISQALGYKPKLTATATVEADIYQMVPALGVTFNYEPDKKFFLKILANSKFSTNTPPTQNFRSIDNVDFADPTNRNIRVLARDGSNAPTMYVVSKKIKLVSADVKIATFSFGSAQKFSKIEITDTNVISIISVEDSNGNLFYEVDYLGQDLIVEERDTAVRGSDGFFSSETMQSGSLSPAKLAIFRKKPRRFVTRINSDMKLELCFGSGTSDTSDELVTLNSTQIANSKYNQVISNSSLDPADFISTDTFGLAPANTTLTVTYLVGGGVQSNVASNTITQVDVAQIANNITDYATAEQGLYNQVVSSVAIINEEPARGGGDTESVEEIRENALAFFNAQNRVVTDKDYLVRSYAMPAQFGSVSKVFVVRDEQINAIARQDSGSLQLNNDQNPFNNRTYVVDPVAPNSINLYVLGHDENKNLATLNTLVKKNLAKYLEQYRVLTDDVNILDAFVVNIGVEFHIVAYRSYNMNDVIARCIDAIKSFFDITNWQINQPIIMNDLRLTIGSVEGVQTVSDVIVTNKYRFKDGRDYFEYRYPIEEATVDDVIYPSLDPSIFEIRYPETDIVGFARQ
jgi:hypothetical protein